MASKKRVLSLDGFTPEKYADLARKIRFLKATVNVSTKNLKNFSHLICETVVCSDKFYFACAQGAWVLTPHYVEESYSVGSWLPEQDYVHSIRDQSQSAELLAAAQRWRWRWHCFKERPFSGWTVAVLAEGEERIRHKKILSLGGASVVPLPLPLADNQNVSGLTYVFMSQADGQAVSHLQDFGLICLQLSFITDTILKDEELDPFEYLVKSTTNIGTEERTDSPILFDLEASESPRLVDVEHVSSPLSVNCTPLTTTNNLQTKPNIPELVPISSSSLSSGPPKHIDKLNAAPKERKSVQIVTISSLADRCIEEIQYSDHIRKTSFSSAFGKSLQEGDPKEHSAPKRVNTVPQLSQGLRISKQIHPMDPNRPVSSQQMESRCENGLQGNKKRKADTLIDSLPMNKKKAKLAGEPSVSVKSIETFSHTQDRLKKTSSVLSNGLNGNPVLSKSIYVHSPPDEERKLIKKDIEANGVSFSKLNSSFAKLKGSPVNSTTNEIVAPKNLSQFPKGDRNKDKEATSPVPNSSQIACSVSPLSASIYLHGAGARENSHAPPETLGNSNKVNACTKQANPPPEKINKTQSPTKVSQTHPAQTPPRKGKGELFFSETYSSPSLSVQLPPSPFVHSQSSNESSSSRSKNPTSKETHLSSSCPEVSLESASHSIGGKVQKAGSITCTSPGLSLSQSSGTAVKQVQPSLQSFGFSSSFTKGQRSTNKKKLKPKQVAQVSSPTIRNLAKVSSPHRSPQQVLVKQEPGVESPSTNHPPSVQRRVSASSSPDGTSGTTLSDAVVGSTPDKPLVILSSDDEDSEPTDSKAMSGDSRKQGQEKSLSILASKHDQPSQKKHEPEPDTSNSKPQHEESMPCHNSSVVEGSITLTPMVMSKVRKSLTSAFDILAKKQQEETASNSQSQAELVTKRDTPGSAAVGHDSSANSCQSITSLPLHHNPPCSAKNNSQLSFKDHFENVPQSSRIIVKAIEVTKTIESEAAQEMTKAIESEAAQEVTKAIESEAAQEVTKAIESEDAQEVTKTIESEAAQEVTKTIESQAEMTKTEYWQAAPEVRGSVPVLYGQWMEAARELGLNDSAVSHGRPTQHLMPTALVLAQLMSLAGEGSCGEDDVASQAVVYLKGWLDLHPPCSPALTRVYAAALRLDRHDHTFLLDWIKKCALVSEASSDYTHSQALLSFIASVFERDFNSCANIGEKKLLQNCLVVSWLWENPLGVFHTSRTCQLVKLLGTMLKSASKSDLPRGPVGLAAFESVCSLIGLAAECIRLASNCWDLSRQSFSSDAVMAIVTDLGRTIAYHEGDLNSELFLLLLNFIQPSWLRAMVTAHILSSSFNSYLLSEDIQVRSLSLYRIVSQYFFLVPPVSTNLTDEHRPRGRLNCQGIRDDGNNKKDNTELAHRKKPNQQLTKRNPKGETVLHTACIKNNVQLLEELLSQPNVNLNVQDNNGYTPLHEACNHGSVKCVELLLKYVPGSSAKHGSMDMKVKGKLPDTDCNSKSNTESIKDSIVEDNQNESSTMLRKADLNAVGPQGITPLHDAVLNNRVAVCRLLLQYGGPRLLKARTELGYTALDLAETAEMASVLQNCSSATNGQPDTEAHYRLSSLNGSQTEESIEGVPLASLYAVLVGEKTVKYVTCADFSHFLSLLSTLLVAYCESRTRSKYQVLGKCSSDHVKPKCMESSVEDLGPELSDHAVLCELPSHCELLRRHVQKLTLDADFESLRPHLDMFETLCGSFASWQ
ncbi:hypothetical protein EGW08_007010 [Elysia chlorotica]|uniref:Uncharacterized protein n=1 Tax=Elysia chlorotica TaxID=188477 RepID=A0A433TUM7_ELYCH|nr:hypothetical protein EGW08_007010 [Elysia chlorotica]